MTKEEMINAYYTNGDSRRNYEEAQRRIKEAMQKGESHVYLPGKNDSGGKFTWSATDETIARLREDGFDIDVVWDPCEFWSIEWGALIMRKECKDCWHNYHCPMSQEGYDYNPDTCPYNPNNENLEN